MSGDNITLDDHAVRSALQRLAGRLSDLTPVMEALGQVLQTATDLTFRDQRDPWGERWEELSEVTIGRRRQGPRGDQEPQILRDMGFLAGSLTTRASRDDLLFGTNLVYAPVQQFGNPDNRFYNTPRGAAAPIPARPFLPLRESGVDLPDEVRDDLLDILLRACERSAAGSGP